MSRFGVLQASLPCLGKVVFTPCAAVLVSMVPWSVPARNGSAPGRGGRVAGQAEAAPQIVSTMRRVTVYGSQFELGRRSSM